MTGHLITIVWLKWSINRIYVFNLFHTLLNLSVLWGRWMWKICSLNVTFQVQNAYHLLLYWAGQSRWIIDRISLYSWLSHWTSFLAALSRKTSARGPLQSWRRRRTLRRTRPRRLSACARDTPAWSGSAPSSTRFPTTSRSSSPTSSCTSRVTSTTHNRYRWVMMSRLRNFGDRSGEIGELSVAFLCLIFCLDSLFQVI